MTGTPQEHVEPPLVFVVDDDEDTRVNLTDILELSGYRVQEAASAQGLLGLRDWHEVALVLLDRRLPDGSPEELLPQIKIRAPHAGVIIVTGYSDIEGAVNCLRAGAADYIVKPVNPDVLTDRIARELRRQRADREIARLNEERKQAADSLVRSEQRHRALFENAMDGFLILNDEWRVVDVNPAACKKFLYEREELVGRQLMDLIVQEDEAQIFSRCLQQARLAGEFKFIRKNQELLDIEYRAVANFSPGLNLLSLRNVTDRKRAEERALQSERLAAIGETMAALVHESRNALQRSSACLEMLELEMEDRPSALDLVARAQRAQEQLRQLYEEVRQWAAPLNPRREPFDVAQVWRQAWKHVIQLHPAGRAQLHEEVVAAQMLKIDRFMIEQVFRNTFENAIDVTPPGGRVWLRCTNGSAAGEPLVRIAIRDEGPGLTAEQQSRIFEPFFTTKAKGTGLGMAISQRIVQAHDGKIAASSPGGAEIEITLPKELS